MTFDRRQFIRTAALLAAAGFVPGELLAASDGAVAFEGYLLSILIYGHDAKLGLLNLKSGALKFIDLDMYHPHSVAQVPGHPSKAIVVCKHGHKIALVDLVDAKVERIFALPTEKNTFFGGHSCFSADKKAFFVAQMGAPTDRATISTRDPLTLAELSKVELESAAPHDMALMPDGKSIALTNYGAYEAHVQVRGSIDIVDVKTGKTLKRGAMAGTNTGTNHLVVSSVGLVAAAGTTYNFHGEAETAARLKAFEGDADFDPNADPAPILIAKPGGAFTEMKDDRALKSMIYGQSLAICEKTNTLAVTYHTGRAITFWDTLSGRLKKSIDFRSGGRGVLVSPDQKYFIGQLYDGELFVFDAVSLEPVKLKLQRAFQTANLRLANPHLYFVDKIS